jgi:uncharacterized protein
MVRRIVLGVLLLLLGTVIMSRPRRRTLRRLPGRTPPTRPAPAGDRGDIAPAGDSGEVAPATDSGEVAPATGSGEVAPVTDSGHEVEAAEAEPVADTVACPRCAELTDLVESAAHSTPPTLETTPSDGHHVAVDVPDPRPVPSRRVAALLTIYLVLIVLAEVSLAFQAPHVSLLIHVTMAIALPIHAALSENPLSRLLAALAFAPIIRIVSLGLPLANVPPVQVYALACLPLFVGVIATARALDLKKSEMGLTARFLPWQIAIGLLGVPFGFLEYVILQPAPVADLARPVSVIWAALVLFVATGLLEELIFRGALQATALDLLGKPGLVYVNLVFAALHIGYQSPLDLLAVFGIGLVFSWVTARTGSILGVSLAHGLTNTLLFIVLPSLWPLR